MKRLHVAMMALAVGAAVTAPGRAAPDAFGHAGGPCYQGALALTAPVANVRAFVPDDFPLLEAAGRAALFAYTVDCRDVAVEAGTPARARLTGVAAFVRPPDGSPGVEAYDIFMTADRADYVAAHTELGLFQGLVEVRFDRSGTLPHVDISAETPWSYTPYAWNLTAVRAPKFGFPVTTVHWQDGTRGRVRIQYDHSDLIATPGIGSLTAAAGSPLAELLGSEQVHAPGAILRFSYSGTVALQP